MTITPILIALLVACFAMLLGLVSLLLMCLWVYRDAKGRGLEAGIWVVAVLFGNVLGLLIYLIAGRKDARTACTQCGKGIPGGGGFCPWCGQTANPAALAPRTAGNRGIIVGAIVSLALCMLLGFGSMIGFFISEGGTDFDFSPSISTFYVESSWGDQWNASWHYTNTTPNARLTIRDGVPTRLYYTAEMDSEQGELYLVLTQGEKEQTVNLTGGVTGEVDLTVFQEGKVQLKLVHDDVRNVRFTSSWG